MKDLDFDNIFSDEDVKDYNLFIGKLKSLKSDGYTTRELLTLVFQYYQKYVTYNYDQLQIVKLNRAESDAPSYPCFKAKEDISDRVVKINKIAQKGEATLRDIISAQEERPYSKEEAISVLDTAFLDVEGRPLTERNKKRIFENYGNIRHIPHQDAKGSGIFKFSEVKEHDEITAMNTSDYVPVYSNQMLVDGVCADYVDFESRLCKDLGIKHSKVRGIGTTGHTWSLIYLAEEDRWAHFDMTMVKFYQDNWIKDYEPYTMQDWVLATTEDIFKMQPTRKILSIGNKKCDFSKDNYSELNITEYTQPDGFEH